MTTIEKRLYTATAESTGGRLGSAKNSDGLVAVHLSIPKAMGGPGAAGATTPEDLFAVGYAACFGSACEFAARQNKITHGGVRVNSEVTIGTIASGGFGLAVKLTVSITGVTQEQAEQIVALGHQVCPYSNATRGNIEVDITPVAV